MNDQEVFSRSWNSDHFQSLPVGTVAEEQPLAPGASTCRVADENHASPIQHVQLILNLDPMFVRSWEEPYLHS